MGVVDFYVQSKVDVSFRNSTGGLIGRHVNFFGRTFWRAWFDLDRVALEPGRRDYLEHRFGTVLTANLRNKALGSIPYYIWLGCHKKPFSSSSLPHDIIERIDALATESPYLLPRNMPNGTTDALTRAVERTAPEIRSKAFDAAVGNLSANLPLPSFFYQNHHWRIYYDDQLEKHTQFNDEYIYAFTWEDSKVDASLLKLGADDVVLAITSAGDNILSYAMQSPARIHAIDLNPSQNHLLELKAAAFTALPYEDFWKIFGDGKHPEFRSLLLTKLSPHLSSRAFQYWLANASIFTNPRGRGLYDTGGSKHAIRAFRWISRLFGCRSAVQALLDSSTLAEQRQIWQTKIRPALLSPLVSNIVVSSEAFLWAALGVPKNQLAMIEADHATSKAVTAPNPTAKPTRAHAIWHYMVNTLDPVLETTHIATDNPYYHVCATGNFSPRCHPDYLSRGAHATLSQPGALDRLRIHTDEIDEVIARLSPGTLTVAIVMDSMDWFDPPAATPATNPSKAPTGTGANTATRQISRLNRALQMGGRVLLRSSAREPWYIREFEALGFVGKQVGDREPGRCIDRVNMYASCWVCLNVGNLQTPTTGFVGDGVRGLGLG
jgi:betaine lipid synthase